VAEDPSHNPRPFDIRTIKHLVALMSRHDLSEIDLCEGDLRIRLRRGARGKVITQVTTPTPTVAPPPAPAVTTAKTDGEAKPSKTDKTLTIKSPTPGTFYAAASPDAEAFVRIGTRVTPTTVVCLIEAMKIFNEITADCGGVITEILVENQQPVEYGQVLFRVDPTA
jgi:acetyl-CoA carboxylase biotin carboxyl carrier protein